jgi:hypothetical protein
VLDNLSWKAISGIGDGRHPDAVRLPNLPWQAAGCDKPKRQGFRGSLRVIGEWATRRRRAENVDAQSLQRVPSARTVARLMTNGRDLLSKSETVTIAAIEAGVPLLVEARMLILDFQSMIWDKAAAGLKNDGAELGSTVDEPRRRAGNELCERSVEKGDVGLTVPTGSADDPVRLRVTGP